MNLKISKVFQLVYKIYSFFSESLDKVFKKCNLHDGIDLEFLTADLADEKKLRLFF